MNKNKPAKPEVGNYGIKELSIRVVNEMDTYMIIDPTEIIEDYNPSIYFNGEKWSIEDTDFFTDGELYEQVYNVLENRITDSCPDDEDTYLVIDELEFNLLNHATDTEWELKI